MTTDPRTASTATAEPVPPAPQPPPPGTASDAEAPISLTSLRLELLRRLRSIAPLVWSLNGLASFGQRLDGATSAAAVGAINRLDPIGQEVFDRLMATLTVPGLSDEAMDLTVQIAAMVALHDACLTQLDDLIVAPGAPTAAADEPAPAAPAPAPTTYVCVGCRNERSLAIDPPNLDAANRPHCRRCWSDAHVDGRQVPVVSLGQGDFKRDITTEDLADRPTREVAAENRAAAGMKGGV